MNYELLVLLLSILISIIGFALMIRDVRAVGQMVREVTAINERNERMTARILTLLAGIEAHDQ